MEEPQARRGGLHKKLRGVTCPKARVVGEISVRDVVLRVNSPI